MDMLAKLVKVLDALDVAQGKLQTFQHAETLLPPPPTPARESWADWYCTVPQTEDNFLDLDTDETLARHRGDEDE